MTRTAEQLEKPYSSRAKSPEQGRSYNREPKRDAEVADGPYSDEPEHRERRALPCNDSDKEGADGMTKTPSNAGPEAEDILKAKAEPLAFLGTYVHVCNGNYAENV